MKHISNVLAQCVVMGVIMLMAAQGVQATHPAGIYSEDNHYHEKVVHAQSNSSNRVVDTEIRISHNGAVVLGGSRVIGINGSTITVSSSWGPTALTWTIVTDGQTKFVRKNGGSSMLGEISVGDTISVNGTLVMSGAPFNVRAEKVRNWSVERADNRTFSGTVQSVNATSTMFVLRAADRGNVTVQATSATRITSGNVTTTFASIAVGGTVQVKGVLNTATNVLSATEIKITSPEMRARTFQGRLQAVANTTLPTFLTVNISGVDYRVNLAADTSILNTLWLRTSLTNFRVGDTIRAYGISNGTTIDATVVRDVSIRL